MSHFQGHFQRFDPFFVRDVPHPGTSPTPFPFPPRAWATGGREEGLQQSPPQRPPCSRRTAYIPAAVPRKHLFYFLLTTPSPAPTRACRDSSHTPLTFHPDSSRNVPPSGTPPTFYHHFRTRCPTFRDISNVLTPFSSDMSHYRGHFQRFTCVFARNVPHPGTSPTF